MLRTGLSEEGCRWLRFAHSRRPSIFRLPHSRHRLHRHPTTPIRPFVWGFIYLRSWAGFRTSETPAFDGRPPRMWRAVASFHSYISDGRKISGSRSPGIASRAGSSCHLLSDSFQEARGRASVVAKRGEACRRHDVSDLPHQTGALLSAGCEWGFTASTVAQREKGKTERADRRGHGRLESASGHIGTPGRRNKRVFDDAATRTTRAPATTRRSDTSTGRRRRSGR